ncbi:MAG: AAA family ATPase [Bdellovibrionales bacterium]|nr:AAA family ATPase [Bdellovibrionales bacterium]
MAQGDSFDPISPDELTHASHVALKILDAVGRQVVGQQVLRRRLLMALITDGHILLEGVPGLAKTLSIKATADAIQASFKRIQFTPDLLPADLIGTEIYKPQEGRFEVRRGPIFANLVLADEINRAPAKVQSALLETMQERQVTIGDQTFRVPAPFFVMATQNPVEQEGTYPLPEAQIDRFIMKVKVDYPTADEEKQMLDVISRSADAASGEPKQFAPVASLDDILHMKKLCGKIYVDDKIRSYIVSLTSATRTPNERGLKMRELIELGASPRATLAFFFAARAEALLTGLNYVTPQHVKDVAHDVLRHRIIPTYEAEAQGLDADDLVQMILDGVQVP